MAGEAHFEIFPSPDGHRFRLRAANGEIVVASEAYESPSGAERGIDDLLAAVAEASTARRELEGRPREFPIQRVDS